MYLTKAYNSIDTLESDINENFYSWQTEYKILDEALLNIVPDKYARIFLIMIYHRMEKKMEYQVCLNMCIFQ